jgi:hypothetical protein
MSFAALGFVLAIVFILIAIFAVFFLQRRSVRPVSNAIWYSDGVGSGGFSSSDASCSPGSDGGGCDGGGGGD